MIRPYENYRDSGIAWLGEIPAHWEVTKIKHVADGVQTGNTPPTEVEEYFENGEFNWFTPADFGDNLLLTNSKRKISDLALNAGVARVFRPKSVLMVGIGATLGKIGLCEEICSANQQVNAITFKKDFNPYFGAYFLKAFSDVIVSQSTASTLAILNQSKTGDLIIVNPPESEKEAIADYLNYKTGQIDKLIAQKEELMNLLQKKRQAIINEAVTQGLNPNAPRRDSGIEWLGEIPAHWEVSKLKYVVNCNGDSLPESTDPDYRFKYIDISSVSLTRGVEKMEEVLFEEAPSRARRKVKDGDIIISTVRTYLKAIAYLEEVEEDVIVSTGFAVLTPNDNRYNKYISYFVKSEEFVNAVVANSVGVSYPAINSSDLMNLQIVLPPYDEIEEITELLDQKTAQIQQAEASLKDQICKLKSYRQSIINEVVTGKVDVREVALNEV